MNTSKKNLKIITCADDFGISSEINKGIIEAHSKGILTSTALLVNAPKTQEAMELAQNHPSLEVGLHLSIVEGIALTGNRFPELLDEYSYFSGSPCLQRNWKKFLIAFFCNKISKQALKEELETQIQFFLKNFPSIPFLNGTQHLHLFPSVNDIVIDLCKKYHINTVRTFTTNSYLQISSFRSAQESILKILSHQFQKKSKNSDIRFTNSFYGFCEGGQLSTKKLLRILSNLPNSGTHEIMFHPGYDCPYLRSILPEGYSSYQWETELHALCDLDVKTFLQNNSITLGRFSQLEKN